MRTSACPKCGEQVSLEAYEMEVINTERVSIANLAHNNGVDCPRCDTYLTPNIVRLNIDVGFVEAKRPAEAPKVVGVGALPLSLVRGG